jgi:hypothetical protein
MVTIFVVDPGNDSVGRIAIRENQYDERGERDFSPLLTTDSCGREPGPKR